MIKLELPENMVSIIGKALGAQPFDLVAPVISELHRQINEQMPRANGRDSTAEKADPIIEIN